MPRPLAAGFRTLALVACALHLASATSAAAPPRLWKAERDGGAGTTIVHLLAVVHGGSSIEADDYVRTRVLPAFMTADVLELEGAQVVAERVGECPIPLAGDDAARTLADARDLARYGSAKRIVATFAMIPAYRHLKDPERIAKDDAEVDTAALSEFGLVITMRLDAQFVRTRIAAASAAPDGVAAPRPVVAVLRSLRPDLPHASPDEPADMVDADCDAGPDRLALLQRAIVESELRGVDGPRVAPPGERDGMTVCDGLPDDLARRGFRVERVP